MTPNDAMGATGRTFLSLLYSTVVIRLDGHDLTKPDLAAKGVVNFVAAKRLGEYLRQHGVNTTEKLFRMSPYDLVRPRLHGPALLWTVMLLLDAAGYDPMEWWGDRRTMATVKRQPKPKKTRRQAAADMKGEL